jgi:surface antigen
VFSSGDRDTGRCRPLYNRTAAPSLCRRLRRCAAATALLAALAGSGCSYQLASLGANDDSDAQPTGSIVVPADRTVQLADAAVPAEIDLAYARAAASEVLARGAKDASVPWQNPQTGAGGNITPLATSYSAGGLSCRDFLASYVHGGSQDWLSGAACRTHAGAWEVKRLTPLRPS